MANSEGAQVHHKPSHQSGINPLTAQEERRCYLINSSLIRLPAFFQRVFDSGKGTPNIFSFTVDPTYMDVHDAISISISDVANSLTVLRGCVDISLYRYTLYTTFL